MVYLVGRAGRYLEYIQKKDYFVLRRGEWFLEKIKIKTLVSYHYSDKYNIKDTKGEIMNYGEQLVMEDSGLLHGAGRVYNKIKESKDLGHVGRTMMKVHRKDISLLKEMRGLANSQAVEHKIYKMIEDVEKWCSWQA